MGCGIDVDGLDELIGKFEEMGEKAKELDGEKEVALEVLFDENFMNEYTSYNDFYKFLEDGGFKVETAEDFDRIPENKLNEYVKRQTKFTSWNEMLENASGEYLENQLF